MTVWVDAWQMQCCEEQFGLGSRVCWKLAQADADWVTAVLGDEIHVDAAEGTPRRGPGRHPGDGRHRNRRALPARAVAGRGCADARPCTLVGSLDACHAGRRLDTGPRRPALRGLPGPSRCLTTSRPAPMRSRRPRRDPALADFRSPVTSQKVACKGSRCLVSA
jgi:hypothetical protein